MVGVAETCTDATLPGEDPAPPPAPRPRSFSAHVPPLPRAREVQGSRCGGERPPLPEEEEPPRSVRTSPLHPGGWPTQPVGRAPGLLQRLWGLGVDVDTGRPALTPGGRPGPGPRQGRRCGAVPRKGLQGPRTKRPHWGRRARGRRGAGISLSGGPRDALCRPDPL